MKLKEVVLKFSIGLSLMSLLLIFFQEPLSAEFYICLITVIINVIFSIVSAILLIKERTKNEKDHHQS